VPIFVDTNVLVYSRDFGEARKQRRALDWLTHLWVTHDGCLSFQVLEEYYSVVTRKLRPPMAQREAREDVAAFLAWRPAVIDDSLLMRAWDLEDRTSVSFWDALIIAAAQAQECTVLLTEDLSDGQDIGGVKVVDPFRTSPKELVKKD
jgi:predicted nucleic acid-binding protein